MEKKKEKKKKCFRNKGDSGAASVQVETVGIGSKKPRIQSNIPGVTDGDRQCEDCHHSEGMFQLAKKTDETCLVEGGRVKVEME